MNGAERPDTEAQLTFASFSTVAKIFIKYYHYVLKHSKASRLACDLTCNPPPLLI